MWLDNIIEVNPKTSKPRARLWVRRWVYTLRLSRAPRLQKQALKDGQRRREDTGVALYNIQQNLARQQMKLEQHEDRRTKIVEKRGESTNRLEEARGLSERMETRNEAIDNQGVWGGCRRSPPDVAGYHSATPLSAPLTPPSCLCPVRDARNEMQKLNDQARTLRENTEKVESGLKMAVRKADKALSVEREAEIAKQKQDLYVDRLGESVRQTEDRLTILTTKIAAQGDLTQQSLQRLNEAQEELDQLKIERREVQQQWQAALIALTKRSEMKHAMLDACDGQQQEIFTLQNELTAVKKQQEEAQEKSEMGELRKRRIDTDKARLQRAVAELNRRIEKAKGDYSVLTSTLKGTEKQLQVATRNYHLQVSKDNELRLRVEKEGQRKAVLQDKLMAETYNTATLTKAGQNAYKAIKAEQKLNAEAEMRLHQEENRLAREEIKAQTLESAMEAVKAERDAARAQLTEKERKLNEYDVESQKNQRDIDRKENDILRLQRKIDTIMEIRAKEGAGRAEVSPLEIKRDSLRAEITSTAKDNSQLQQQWLQSQHEFVLLTKEMAETNEAIEELRTRNSVLLRKKLRLTREVEQNEIELRRAKNKYSLMQNDIVKLNALINKNAKTADSLESGTELMEVDFLRMLKDEELESIKLQETIEETAQARTQLDQDVVESEREILLWEKKIQLAEEMKATLKGDDESGSELQAMKAEIHRMELRSAQLARQKEVLIQEMEKSVERRGEIDLRATAAKNNKNNTTVSKVKKQVVDLRKRVKQTQADAAAAEKQAVEIEEEVIELRARTEDARRELQEAFDAVEDAKREVARQKRQRNGNLAEIAREQGLYRHLNTLKQKARVFKKSSEEYDAAIQSQIHVLQNLNNVAEYVVQNHPEYGPLFDPVAEDVSSRLAQMK